MFIGRGRDDEDEVADSGGILLVIFFYLKKYKNKKLLTHSSLSYILPLEKYTNFWQWPPTDRTDRTEYSTLCKLIFIRVHFNTFPFFSAIKPKSSVQLGTQEGLRKGTYNLFYFCHSISLNNIFKYITLSTVKLRLHCNKI